jgi:hypothetical protein
MYYCICVTMITEIHSFDKVRGKPKSPGHVTSARLSFATRSHVQQSVAVRCAHTYRLESGKEHD